MNLKIKNFGKIAEADIKLDGITVICGENNSGKSTIGKALFSFFNSFYDYESKITDEKTNLIYIFIRNASYHYPLELYKSLPDRKDIFDYVSEHQDIFTIDEIRNFVENCVDSELDDEKLEALTKSINADGNEIIGLATFRYFENVMNGQIRNMYSLGNSTSSVEAIFKNNSGNVQFYGDRAFSCEIKLPLEHKAYFIGNPFIIDYLNSSFSTRRHLNIMEKSVVIAIAEAQADINENPMTNILDSVINVKDLEEIKKILKKAYSGATKITNGKYYYSDKGNDFDIRNISAGLKAFALIERMLETGVLKHKDVLILDEPEIHLHSEWQIIYAELIVALQVKFDLTVLIVTHSFQFLESLDFFMKKYLTSDKGNYYIPEQTDKGVVMKSCENDAVELKKNLTTGSVTLSDLKFSLEMENYHEEDN